MPKQVPTLKDLAAECGVSVSTVSRALQGHTSISEATIHRIQTLAAQRGYVPNGVARGLRHKNTRTIGVLVPEIRHDFFSSAIDGIEEMAFGKGYTVHIAKSDEEYQREVMNTLSFSANRVAGVIASVSQNTKDGEHFQRLIDAGIPVVLFDRILENLNVHKVIIDDYSAAFRAVTHLIKSGYRRIAHLAGPDHLNIARERLRGYSQALLAAHMPVESALVQTCELSEEGGMAGMQNLLSLSNPPDAVFAVNDPVAVGAHMQIRAAGLRMPDDVGLMGFSNNPITQLIDPPLTTTDQHGYELGRKAAKILLSLIKQGANADKPETHIVPSTFIERASSQRTPITV